MADLTITAGNLSADSTATTASGTAGEDIDVGEVVALHASNGKLMLAVNSDATLSKALGIALNNASDGQRLNYLVRGLLNTTSALGTNGEVYCLSGNSGKIAPEADVVSGDYMVVLGTQRSTTQWDIAICRGETAIP